MIIIIIYMYKKIFWADRSRICRRVCLARFPYQKRDNCGLRPKLPAKSLKFSHRCCASICSEVYTYGWGWGRIFLFYLFLRLLSSLSSPEKFSLLNLRRVALPLTSSSPSPLQSFLLYFKSLKGIRSSLLNCGWIAALLIVSVNESAIHPLKWVIH